MPTVLEVLGKEKLGNEGDWRLPEYQVWYNMIRRCLCDHDDMFKWYGAIGRTVCRRWLESFHDFLSDVGRRPTSRHSIDRIKNDLHYSCGSCDQCIENGWPMNCRWADWTTQSNNRSNSIVIEIDGKSNSIQGWSEVSGISHFTIRCRIRNGWNPVDAIFKATNVGENASQNDSKRYGGIRSRLFAEYISWKKMRASHSQEICNKWNSFELFIEDVGERPTPRHKFVRINKAIEFGPGNCEWRLNTRKIRQVVCVETNEVFESTANAANSIGVCVGAMSHCLSGRTKTCGGLHWRYVE